MRQRCAGVHALDPDATPEGPASAFTNYRTGTGRRTSVRARCGRCARTDVGTVPITSADPARIVVVDDHPVVLDGVRLLIQHDPALNLVGGADTGASAVEMVQQHLPDVVLLDLRLPDILASDLVLRLRETAPSCRIVLFTAYREHAGLQVALDAGVDGCLLKDAGATDLIGALHQAASGVRVFDPRISGHNSGRIRARLHESGLTHREYEVVRRAAAGRTNPEIAAELTLTRHTITGYMKNAMRKLDARNRIELVTKASQAGLL